MKLLAVCSPSFCKSASLRTLVLKTVVPHHRVNFADSPQELEGEDLVKFIADADIAIIGRERITETVLSKLPKLKAISKYGVGLDNIDFDACKKCGIRVYFQEGVNADSVAEHTVGLMLSVFRNIGRSDRLFHQGVWWKNGGTQLSGKKVGIVGFGAIGSRVAALLKTFRCSLFVNEIDTQKENAIRASHFQNVSLDTLLSECDAVSLHIPFNAHTHHLFDAHKISLMKPHSILINTARGKVVDEKALKAALLSGHLGGAGLDVFEEEPVRDPELFKIETLVATAHMAGNSSEAVLAMGRAAIDGAREFLFNRRH